MKKFFIFFVMTIFLITGCKKDSDVLLTYKGGQITRKELKEWTNIHHYNAENVFKSKKYQEKYLKDMAVEQIAAIEAIKMGLDKNKDSQTYINITLDSYKARTHLDKNVSTAKDFKETAYEVQHIFIAYEPETDIDEINAAPKEKTKEELEALKTKATAKANDIMTKLASGADFSKIAVEVSEDYLKESAGKLGFVLPDMVPEEYKKAMISLQKGEYTKTPVLTDNGIYIIKLLEKKEITIDTVGQLSKEEAQVERMKSAISDTAIQNHINKLKTEKDVVFNKDKIGSLNPSDVIFSIGNETFKVEDLFYYIKLYDSNYSDEKVKTLSVDEKEEFVNSFFELKVLKRDAERNNIEKNEEYSYSKKILTDLILAREFFKTMKFDEKEITEEMIKEDYEKYKETRYSSETEKDGKVEKKIQPYEEVKNDIRNELIAVKKSSIENQWKEKAEKEYDVKVITGKLEGK